MMQLSISRLLAVALRIRKDRMEKVQEHLRLSLLSRKHEPTNDSDDFQPPDGSKTFKIPFLYREGLELTQGRA